MWRVCREAGRAWPRLSDDDVIDYMVMEAVYLKVKQEEREAEKEQQRAQWKKSSIEELKQYT